MDYEQKYKEALSRAKVVNPGTKDYNIVTAIFPELKESNDERIRKELLDYLDKRRIVETPVDTKVKEEWISWLEKQGKQEQLYIRFGEIPTDEKSKIYQGEIEVGTENGVSVYPAFKTDEGDIVLGLNLPITKTTLYTQQHLLEYDNRPCYLVKGDYVGKDSDGQPLINNISIIEKIEGYRINEKNQGNQANPYSGISFEYNGHTWGMCARDNGVDILLDKQLFKHFEKQGEKKPTWSEEDEDSVDITIRIIQNGGDNCAGILDSDKALKWLQSLKQRLNGTE